MDQLVRHRNAIRCSTSECSNFSRADALAIIRLYAAGKRRVSIGSAPCYGGA